MGLFQQPASHGFTLVELLIALAIVGALVTILLGGLRVGLEAWRAGEDRAELHQRFRSAIELLQRSIASTYPYRGKLTGEEVVLLFRGTADRLEFVTEVPPFPTPAPIAFSAVSVSLGGTERPGLTVTTKPLPNHDPFEGGTATVIDPEVARLEFSYVNPDGEVVEGWNGTEENRLPRAVRLALTVRSRGREEALPALLIPLSAERP